MLNNLPANPARRARRADLGRATPGRPHHRLDCAGSEEAPVQVIAGLLNVSHPGLPNVAPQCRSDVGQRDSPHALSTATTEAFPCARLRTHRQGQPSTRPLPHQTTRVWDSTAPARPSVAPARPRRPPCAGSSDRQRPRPLSALPRQGGAREHRDRSLADQLFRPRSGIEHLGARPVLAEPPARSRSEDSTIDEAERSLRIPSRPPVDRRPIGCAPSDPEAPDSLVRPPRRSCKAGGRSFHPAQL